MPRVVPRVAITAASVAGLGAGRRSRLLSRIAAATSGRQEADERCDDGEATYMDERLRVQVLIFDCLPRTSSSPRKERSCGGFSRASCVDSATRIDPTVVLVIASRRDAVFTVSPWTVYSSCRGEPTFPDMKYPLFSPMPIAKPSPKSCSRSQ